MTLSLTDINKEIRKFGAIAFLFFGILFIIALWRQKEVAAYFFGVLFLLGMGLFIFPGPLKPVYDKWLTIGHFIGRVVTTVMLTLAYYLVITPSSLMKRLISGTPVPLKPDKKVLSYWVSRSEAAQPKERFIKRF